MAEGATRNETNEPTEITVRYQKAEGKRQKSENKRHIVERKKSIDRNTRKKTYLLQIYTHYFVYHSCVSASKRHRAESKK